MIRAARTKAVRAVRAMQCTMVRCTVTAVQREASLLSYLSATLGYAVFLYHSINRSWNLSCLNAPEFPRCKGL